MNSDGELEDDHESEFPKEDSEDEFPLGKDLPESFKVYCGICEEVQFNRGTGHIHEHMASHRGQIGSRTFTCSQCFFVTGVKELLESHLADTHGLPESIDEEDYPIQFGLDVEASLLDRIEFDQTRETMFTKSKFCQIADQHLLRRLVNADAGQPLSNRSSYERFFCIYWNGEISGAHWYCRICKRKLSRQDPYALRFAVLLHLDDHVTCKHKSNVLDDRLTKCLKREWKRYEKEIGSSLAVFRQRSQTLENSENRSFAIYLSADQQLIDFFNSVTESKHQIFDLCLLCARPVWGSSHYTRHHCKRKIKLSWSEFYAVDAADLSVEPPQSLFQIERVLKKSKRDEFDGILFYRWCCRKPDCAKKSLCTQCDFPNMWLTRAYALSHLEKHHSQLFNKDFFDYEWKLVQYDSRMPADIYDFRLHLPKVPIDDIGDPNLFALTANRVILAENYAALHICSICYYTDLNPGFMNHITTEHGFCYDRIDLHQPMKSRRSIPGPKPNTKRQFIEIADRLKYSIVPPLTIIKDMNQWNEVEDHDVQDELTIERTPADNEILAKTENDLQDSQLDENREVSDKREEIMATTSQSTSVFSPNSASLIKKTTISRILEGYDWEGDQPDPLSYNATTLLQAFLDRHFCVLCNKSIPMSRTDWQSDRMKETSLLAHLFIKHPDESIREELVNQKLYALSVLRWSEKPQYFPFRLNSAGSLTCSSCIDVPKSFPLLGRLQAHWEKCSVTKGSLSTLYTNIVRRKSRKDNDMQTTATTDTSNTPANKRIKKLETNTSKEPSTKTLEQKTPEKTNKQRQSMENVINKDEESPVTMPNQKPSKKIDNQHQSMNYDNNDEEGNNTAAISPEQETPEKTNKLCESVKKDDDSRKNENLPASRNLKRHHQPRKRKRLSGGQLF
ncbi:unnamed protein product, partial [Mesorhabditis belari]|uniref:C2H2-type domain-containing protein n=1 Tax=Mesorhabditis belari TaxID=2138241 RepID=A0AAF3FKD4_9BILA